MRIVSILLVLTVLYHPAQSQISKGQWMVGGTADFSKNKSTNDQPQGYNFESKLTSYEAAPGAGYFVMDRFCTGLRFAILGSKGDQEVTSTAPYNSQTKIKTESSGFGISPFARYYLLKPSGKWNIFADGSYLYSHTKTESSFLQVIDGPIGGPPSASSSSSTSDANVHSFILSAGPAFFLNPKVSLELSVGISHSSYEDSDMTGTTFVIGAGFQIHLGKLK